MEVKKDLKKHCSNCGQMFLTARSWQEFCCKSCKALFWKKERPQLPAAGDVLADDSELREVLRLYLDRAYGDSNSRRRFHIRY